MPICFPYLTPSKDQEEFSEKKCSLHLSLNLADPGLGEGIESG